MAIEMQDPGSDGSNDERHGGMQGELFSDPETRLVWAAVSALSEGQLRELLAHMQSRVMLPELRSGTHAQRIARVVSALHAAADELRREHGSASPADVNLTEAEYERLRSLNDMEGWPPASTARRWMGGSWNDALRQAKLRPVFDGDALVRDLGPKFSREELLDAVMEYHREGHEEIPTVRGFIAWAKRPDVRTRPGRRPRSLGPINRLFPAGWPQVLAAAKLIAVDETPGDEARASWGLARPAWGTGYREEHVVEALVACATSLGRSPKMAQYQGWREEQFRAQREGGALPRAIPSSSLIQNRYPTWDDALAAAGLARVHGRQHPQRTGNYPPRRKRVSDEEIFTALCDAYQQIGDPFTVTAYERWRKAKIAENRRNRVLDRVPSYHVMHDRFDDWATAVRRAHDWQSVQRAAARQEAAGGRPSERAEAHQEQADDQPRNDRGGTPDVEQHGRKETR